MTDAPRLDDLVAILGIADARPNDRRRRGLMIALPLSLLIGAVAAGVVYEDGSVSARDRDRIMARQEPSVPPVLSPAALPLPRAADPVVVAPISARPREAQLASHPRKSSARAPQVASVRGGNAESRPRAFVQPIATDDRMHLAMIEKPQRNEPDAKFAMDVGVVSVDRLEARDAMRALRLR